MDDDTLLDGDDTEMPTSAETGSMSDPAGARGGGSAGDYSDELYSKKIQARSRLFYVDLKESSNGKFVKISEKSRGGQRSTIMFDEEDLDEFINTFKEIKEKL